MFEGAQLPSNHRLLIEAGTGVHILRGCGERVLSHLKKDKKARVKVIRSRSRSSFSLPIFASASTAAKRSVPPSAPLDSWSLSAFLGVFPSRGSFSEFRTLSLISRGPRREPLSADAPVDVSSCHHLNPAPVTCDCGLGGSITPIDLLCTTGRSHQLHHRELQFVSRRINGRI